MKLLFVFLFSILFLYSCESVGDQLMNSGKIESFKWLVGNWKRTNDSPPYQTFENWQQVDDSLYIGHGFIMIEKDTLWQEFIKLKHENYKWNFIVIGKGDSLATFFELGLRDTMSFISFNLKNDFPSHIKYERKNDSLKALIWGDTSEVSFNFIKTE